MTRLSIGLVLLLSGIAAGTDPAPHKIPVRLQRDGTAVVEQRAFEPAKSAIIICDMWDDHWCKEASKRCDALAKKANPVVEAARKAGVTIIHCPSDCMEFYKDHPARKRTLAVTPTPVPKDKALPNPPLPIDDTDGGCDDAAPAKSFRAWKKQHDAIVIDDEKDYLTDKGSEAYSVLAKHGVKTVFVMGVHTNMCVLHRSFAIKQLRRWDVECYLVRDLTDAMYNPAKKPFVSHDAGTNLVIGYIEQHWCPSVLSKDLASAVMK